MLQSLSPHQKYFSGGLFLLLAEEVAKFSEMLVMVILWYSPGQGEGGWGLRNGSWRSHQCMASSSSGLEELSIHLLDTYRQPLKLLGILLAWHENITVWQCRTWWT